MSKSKSDKLRFRIRKGDLEVELEGRDEYVKGEYERLLDKLVILTEPTPEKIKAELQPNIPRTIADKLKRLRDEGFFKEPKDSGSVVKELRDRGWGVYVSKDISSALKKYAARLGLRRVPIGKGRYSYTYP